MANWKCVQNCGACCHLDPTARPDLETYLTTAELELYLGMVGEDGWCINFNAQTRQCDIYDERPRFCRVQPDIFQQMYDVEITEFEDFAVECCQEQISGVYGEDSQEMERYDEQVVI